MTTHNVAPRGPAVEGPLTEQAQAGLDALRADPMGTAAVMVQSVPRRPLPGALTLQRRTGAATGPTSAPAGLAPLNVPPTRAGAAALRVGENIAAAVLAEGVPATLAGRAAQYARITGRVVLDNHGDGLTRRGPLIAEAAAAHYINFVQSRNLNFVRLGTLRAFYDGRLDGLTCPDYTPRSGEADDSRTDGGPLAAAVADAHIDPGDVCECGNVHSAPLTAELTSRPRLAWAHQMGIADGLLLDRFHHTHYATVIGRDTAIGAHVLRDMRRMAAFLAPADNLTGHHHGHATDQATLDYLAGAILGVRVISHLVPADAVHFLPAFADGAVVLGAQHPVGDCEACVCVTDLPNSRPVGTTGPQHRDAPNAPNSQSPESPQVRADCEASIGEQRSHQVVRPSAALFNPANAFRPQKEPSEDTDAQANDTTETTGTTDAAESAGAAETADAAVVGRAS